MFKWITCLVWAVLLLTSSVFAAESYELDSQHSYVLWKIKHFGFSTQTGKWYAHGQLLLDKEQPEKSKVTVKIDIATVITGIPELDKHLLSPEFFDVAKFPTAEFVSQNVKITGKYTAIVSGMLTLHGITKPIDLNVRFTREAKNPVTNHMTVGFTGESMINRSDFGMNAFLPGLGNEVKLEIWVEAFKEKDK